MIDRLVLLPGMHGTGELFSEFMKMIPEPKHIEAISYPTDASPSYAQLLRLVQSFVPAADSYFVLAESFSTPLAIQFAAANPANLRGLILCAGFASSPLTGSRCFVASMLAPLLFRLPIFDFAMDRFLIGPNAPESLKAAIRGAVSSVSPEVLAARLRVVLSCDAREALSRVTVPTLYIQAAKDRIVPKSCLDEIRCLKPDLRVAEIDGPHLILQREPRQSADLVTKFIEEFQ
jgi:pimeloyl-[acyl-carrier protein] methyl ester esterase